MILIPYFCELSILKRRLKMINDICTIWFGDVIHD